MRVTLAFVPPGGGETDYSLDFDMPALPRAGDYISINRPGNNPKARAGMLHFMMRRVHWFLKHSPYDPSASLGNQEVGTTSDAIIECEFARGPTPSEEHDRSCDMYEARGKPIQRFDDTVY